MIQPDTISVISDSTLSVSDSVARMQALATADSIHLADSLRAIAQIPRGFTGIPHPSIPQTESWVFIVLLLFFFFVIYTLSQSAGLITDIVKSFFQVKERSSIFSKATVNDSRFRFFFITFALGVVSFYLCLLMHKPDAEFSLKEFGLFVLITSVFILIKNFIFELIGYVFLNHSAFKMAKDSYFNIFSFLGMALFPLLFLQIYSPDKFQGVSQIIALIVSISAGLLIIFKLFQIFFHKILASFYILLYLCTLEILPLIVLFNVYKMIV